MPSILIDHSVKKLTPNFKIKSIKINNTKIEPSSDKIIEYTNSELENISKFFQNREDIYNDEIINGIRTLYKDWGIDPSRYRPSPERILRNLTSGKNFSFINNIVDISNIISVKYRIAVSIYDFEKLEGNLVIKKSVSEDKYLAITSRYVGTKDKVLIYDDKGPVGSPTVDSDRTKITENTKKIIFVIYAPENVSEKYIKKMIDDYSEKINEFNLGNVEN